MNNDAAIFRINNAILSRDTFLDLGGLGLTNVPPEIFEMEWLEIINLSNNSISDITPIKSLRKIKLIDVRNNMLSEFKEDILSIGLPIKWDFEYSQIGIFIGGNPIQNMPIEILKQGNDAILSYLNACKISGKIAVQEVKIIVLGDGGVGKTSLIKSLLDINSKLPIDIPFTRGIEIRTARFHANNTEVKANIWDFGGQEIYHTTHQLFLTERTLYLLVFDARRDHISEYWLNTIETFANRAPVIIVVNKIDQNPHYSFDEYHYKSKNPNIISFQKVSCLTKEGIPDLLSCIQSNIASHSFLNIIVPSQWRLVKERLESINLDYIENTEYARICWECNVCDLNDQNTLSNFLHDLGTIVHFKKLPLFSTHVLNPFWITEAITLVISSEVVFKHNGRISLEIITEIFAPFSEKYPYDKLRFIIDVMIEFEMLFEIGDNLFVIPSLLPQSRPILYANPANSVIFYFSYNFLPSNLFSRVQVRIQNYRANDFIWRYGIQISNEKSSAVIEFFRGERKIKIQCSGIEKKELLFVIREMVRKINQSYSNIIVNELVHIGNEYTVDYDELKQLQEEKIETQYYPKLQRHVKVSDIIESIEPANKNELTPIRIFISYSHKDIDFKKELINHLAPLIRLNEIAIWEDSKLIPGQQWEPEIIVKLRESDLILCLISSDFIASEFCYSVELKEALDSHFKKDKVVIPVLIRKCYWQKLPIAAIQGVPNPPISSQNNADEGWVDVVSGVDKSLELIRMQKYS